MPSPEPSRPILDHIVVLVSEAILRTLPNKLADFLTIIDGGEHSDGLTFNKLVLFKDGVYIELLAFYDGIDRKRREKHRWGKLKEGHVIDWAFTLPKESDFIQVQHRVEKVNAGVTYDDPWSMGRTRPDGVVLKWSIGASRYSDGTPTFPGILPFWCLDQTNRKFRVPYENSKATAHPSGAQGVSQVHLSVDKADYSTLRNAYDAIFNAKRYPSSTSWEFVNYAGISTGRQALTITEKNEITISITLSGGSKSPESIELIPGLRLQFENE